MPEKHFISKYCYWQGRQECKIPEEYCDVCLICEVCGHCMFNHARNNEEALEMANIDIEKDADFIQEI